MPTWEASGSPLRRRPAPPSSSVALLAHRCLGEYVSHGVQFDNWEVDPPFSRRIRSNNEFLYRSIKHSSAALR